MSHTGDGALWARARTNVHFNKLHVTCCKLENARDERSAIFRNGAFESLERDASWRRLFSRVNRQRNAMNEDAAQSVEEEGEASEARSGTRLRARHPQVPYRWERLAGSEMLTRAREYANAMQSRRSVREFSNEPFPLEILTEAVRAASSAPSGANQQPWTFVIVTDPALKQRIRDAAEIEERKNWEGRMSPEWVAALLPLGVDASKRHLTDAPALVVVFAQRSGVAETDDRGIRHVKHYYVDESVGIAVGLLLSALRLAGLGTLTHTPSPMGFLRELLGRPSHERAYVVVPVGYPAVDAHVPDIARKPFDEVCILR
jgi:iodotyrosine deiodinase